MYFDKPMKPMGRDELPRGIVRLPGHLQKITNHLLPKDEPGITREAPPPKSPIEEICGKAERDKSGNISVPYGNILLHLVMRYIAPRYSLEEMLDIAARQKDMDRETLAKEFSELGEIRTRHITMDVFLNSLEIEETPEDELDELAKQFNEIKAAITPEEMIAALSREEMYYTAALRMMCRHIDRTTEKN